MALFFFLSSTFTLFQSLLLIHHFIHLSLTHQPILALQSILPKTMNEATKVKPHTHAPSPPSERQEVMLPPVHHSREELMHMHPKDLIQILDDRHIDHTGMVEKQELVDQIMTKCTR
jgi:hypothetical protein